MVKMMAGQLSPNSANAVKSIRSAGFSLVEVMVSMVIGLLTMIIIMQSYAAFEGQKRTTTSGSDAQENGLTALHAIETDVRMAGFGMITPTGLACTQMNYSFNGTPYTGTSAAPLLPVIIADSATSGVSDTITITYSDSVTGGNPTVLTGSMSDSNADVAVDWANGVGFKADQDLMLIGTPGSGNPCMRLAYTSAPSPTMMLYNPPTASSIAPLNGYLAYQSFVMNMGNFVRKKYDIETNDLYSVDVGPQGDWTRANGTASPPNLHLANNIVNLQAQYGVAPINMNPGVSSPAVTCWTDATDRRTDATAPNDCKADWRPPNPATGAGIAASDAARIKAVRIAVVARNSLQEQATSGVGNAASCDKTLAAPIAWIGTASSPAPTINLVPMTAAPDQWQCHRYRVYQTIIPLRNIIWANI